MTYLWPKRLKTHTLWGSTFIAHIREYPHRPFYHTYCRNCRFFRSISSWYRSVLACSKSPCDHKHSSYIEIIRTPWNKMLLVMHFILWSNLCVKFYLISQSSKLRSFHTHPKSWQRAQPNLRLPTTLWGYLVKDYFWTLTKTITNCNVKRGRNLVSVFFYAHCIAPKISAAYTALFCQDSEAQENLAATRKGLKNKVWILVCSNRRHQIL